MIAPYDLINLHMRKTAYQRALETADGGFARAVAASLVASVERRLLAAMLQNGVVWC